MSNVLELPDETFDQATSHRGLRRRLLGSVVRPVPRHGTPDRASRRPAAAVRFAKVNLDENPALASAYGVRAIPTLAILRDGELLGTAPGLVRSDKLVAALDRVAAETADAPRASGAAGRA